MYMMQIFTKLILFGIFLKYVSCTTTYTCSTALGCGCSPNPAVLNKIVGGEAATSQTWGWAVSIRYKSTNSHFCGGSIISASHILTAAHCAKAVSSASLISVYVGSTYLSKMIGPTSVTKMYIHPEYSSSNSYINDIAILKLSSPLNLDQSSVNLVCLPNVSSTVLATQEYPTANTNLIAIGWGYLQENVQSVSSTLQQVTIQAVAATSTYCQNLRLADVSKQFCAGVMPGGGKDTCQGDSGGPLLMFTSNNVWEQVGITSNGYGCARANYPGVYTRVAAYQTWINETMNSGNKYNYYSSTIFISIIFSMFFSI